MITSNARKPPGILHPKHGEQYFQRHPPFPDVQLSVEHFWSVQWNVPKPQGKTLPQPSIHPVVEGGTP